MAHFGPTRRALPLTQRPQPRLQHVLSDGLQPGLLISRACSSIQPPAAVVAAASALHIHGLLPGTNIPVAAKRALTCRKAVCSASIDRNISHRRSDRDVDCEASSSTSQEPHSALVLALS